ADRRGPRRRSGHPRADRPARGDAAPLWMLPRSRPTRPRDRGVLPDLRRLSNHGGGPWPRAPPPPALRSLRRRLRGHAPHVPILLEIDRPVDRGDIAIHQLGEEIVLA